MKYFTIVGKPKAQKNVRRALRAAGYSFYCASDRCTLLRVNPLTLQDFVRGLAVQGYGYHTKIEEG